MPQNEWFEFLSERDLGPEIVHALEVIYGEGMDSALNGPGSASVKARYAHLAGEVMREWIESLRALIPDDEEEDADEPE